MRYVLEIRYHGRPFHGWQRQPNAASVQQLLEEGLGTILREPIGITGAGRTDAGVHALQQWAHFDTPQALSARLVEQLNGWLPPSVAVLGLYRPHSERFHARYDATCRSYAYHILRRKDPFWQDRSWLLRGIPLELSAMQEAVAVLRRQTDFASFCKAHGNNQTTLCQILDADWAIDSELLTFRISANRFLRGMVRAIVGTLVEVGKKQRTPADFRALFAQRSRAAAGPSAPPGGLFLTHVQYPNGSLERL